MSVKDELYDVGAGHNKSDFSYQTLENEFKFHWLIIGPRIGVWMDMQLPWQKLVKTLSCQQLLDY